MVSKSMATATGLVSNWRQPQLQSSCVTSPVAGLSGSPRLDFNTLRTLGEHLENTWGTVGEQLENT